MNKKILFYKSIIWQMIGMIWISILSYLWFGDLIRSLSFTIVVVVVSIFAYIFYEMAWENFLKKSFLKTSKLEVVIEMKQKEVEELNNKNKLLKEFKEEQEKQLTYYEMIFKNVIKNNKKDN